MKMKKIVPLVLAACTILTGCNHGGTGGNSNLKNETIIAAEGMTYDELLAKAKEEVGNGTVSVYGNSSQLEKALKKFTEETGLRLITQKKVMLIFTITYQQLSNLTHILLIWSCYKMVTCYKAKCSIQATY